jgi:hypothetical protein
VLHGIILEKCEGCQVVQNTVYENVLWNFPRTTEKDWAGGITYFSGSNGRIHRNRVYTNHGEGIGTNGGWGHPGTDHLEISGNIVYDNWSVNIWLDHGSNVRVDGNFVFVTGNPPFPAQYKSIPDGIMCAEEKEFGRPGDLHSGIITNNVVVRCRSGFRFWKDNDGSGIRNFIVANNTFVHGKNFGISLEDGNHTNSLFINNIIYSDQGTLLHYDTPGQAVFNHNLWFSKHPKPFYWAKRYLKFEDWKRVKGIGSQDKSDHPKFVDAAGFTAESYQITQNSPGLNTGLYVPEVKVDFWQQPRPQGNQYDMGAHEARFPIEK